MQNLKKSFITAKTRMNERIRKHKDDDEEFISLDREYDALKKSTNVIREGLEKYVEPRSQFRSRLSAQAYVKGKSKKDSPIESDVLHKLLAANSTAYGMSKDVLGIIVDIFQQLEEAKFKMEEVFFNIKTQFKEQYDEPISMIHAANKNVANTLVTWNVLKSDKKATSNSVEEAEHKLCIEKVKRKNVMIDYIHNSNEERMNTFKNYFNLLQEYHEECASKIASFNKEWEDLESAIKEKGHTPHLPLPVETSFSNDGSFLQKEINFSDDSYDDEEGNQSTTQGDICSGYLPQAQQSSGSVANSNYVMATVLYDFIAENDDDLECKQGDRIKVLEQVDENWAKASLGDNIGVIPYSYIQIDN